MKKIVFACIALIVTTNAFSQLAWVEPDPTIATEKITIYVDLSKLDLSLEHNQKIVDDPGPMYIWTWKPAELGANSPNVNGTGEKPWQNSSETLKMTAVPEKGAKVWKYEMVPTEFYGVTASAVYASGISLIVKPKNGGGFGTPDIKTNDISISINPPSTDKGALYNFPTVLLENEITTIVYDNSAEKKPTMQNLDPGTVLYCYLKAIAKDSITGVVSTYEPYKLLQVLNKPQFEMTYSGANKWTMSLIVNDYFRFPPTAIPQEMEMRVLRANWASDDDTGGNFTKLPVAKFGCK
jgi:hypothetical protein